MGGGYINLKVLHIHTHYIYNIYTHIYHIWWSHFQ